MKSGLGSRFPVKVLLFAMLAMGLCVLAGENDKQEAQKQATQWQTLYAVRDAETGQLRPMTAAERQAAGKEALIDREGIKPETAAKTGSHVNAPLKGYSNVVVIRRNADGSFSESCLDSMAAVNKFINTDKAEGASRDQ